MDLHFDPATARQLQQSTMRALFDRAIRIPGLIINNVVEVGTALNQWDLPGYEREFEAHLVGSHRVIVAQIKEHDME